MKTFHFWGILTCLLYVPLALAGTDCENTQLTIYNIFKSGVYVGMVGDWWQCGQGSLNGAPSTSVEASPGMSFTISVENTVAEHPYDPWEQVFSCNPTLGLSYYPHGSAFKTYEMKFSGTGGSGGGNCNLSFELSSPPAYNPRVTNGNGSSGNVSVDICDSQYAPCQ